MGGFPNSRSTTFSQPLKPPEPVAATLSVSTLDVTVTFDRLLRSATLGTAPWGLIANLGAGARLHHPTAGPVASGAVVTFTAVDVGPGFGANIIQYTAPGLDLYGRSGLLAPQFFNFPLQLIA